MRFVLLSVLVAAGVYATLLGALYMGQRSIVFVPDTAMIDPAVAGLPQAQPLRLRTDDGESIVAWYVPPREGAPLLLYFHGNGGNLSIRADRFAELTRDGAGLLAIDYRGYGGSTGSPTEDGLHLDAQAALAAARAHGFGPERIVLMGESLGTGVAVALARGLPFAGVVLEAAYSSAADVGAATYWMFPVRLLMRDPFRSDRRIAKLQSPLLFVHGTADGVIPIRFGQRLYDLAPEPKEFIAVPGAGHQPLEATGILQQVRAWIGARGRSAEQRSAGTHA